jgi:anti-sigma B factor antagonist
MKVNAEPLQPNGCCLSVEGQVDMHTSPELRGKLRECLDRKASPLVVDLTRVGFIDSSGLATLIEALQAVGKYGGRLRLCGLSPAVKNLFKLSNLISIFDIRAKCDEAARE